MKAVFLGMIVSMALAVGCGEVQTDQQAKGDSGDDIASVEMKTTFRGKKVGKNLTKAAENIQKMTTIVKDDVTRVTGEAKRVAEQVSAVTKDGVGVDITLAPKTKPVTEWEYHEVNATEKNRKEVLAEQGRLGWELTSERPHPEEGFILQLKRAKP